MKRTHNQSSHHSSHNNQKSFSHSNNGAVSKEDKEEEKLLRPAIPLDGRDRFQDDEYELPDEDEEALKYLMAVRQEAKQLTKHSKIIATSQSHQEGRGDNDESTIFKSAKHQREVQDYGIPSQALPQGHDRDYIQQSLARMYFQSSEQIMSQIKSHLQGQDQVHLDQVLDEEELY